LNLAAIPFFAHHGIIFVPSGFAAPELNDLGEVVGGSAYGAAAIAGGDGSRQVTEKELAIAKYASSPLYFARFFRADLVCLSE